MNDASTKTSALVENTTQRLGFVVPTVDDLMNEMCENMADALGVPVSVLMGEHLGHAEDLGLSAERMRMEQEYREAVLKFQFTICAKMGHWLFRDLLGHQLPKRAAVSRRRRRKLRKAYR